MLDIDESLILMDEQNSLKFWIWDSEPTWGPWGYMNSRYCQFCLFYLIEKIVDFTLKMKMKFFSVISTLFFLIWNQVRTITKSLDLHSNQLALRQTKPFEMELFTGWVHLRSTFEKTQNLWNFLDSSSRLIKPHQNSRKSKTKPKTNTLMTQQEKMVGR